MQIHTFIVYADGLNRFQAHHLCYRSGTDFILKHEDRTNMFPGRVHIIYCLYHHKHVNSIDCLYHHKLINI